MDNSNNPNWPNNPASPLGGPSPIPNGAAPTTPDSTTTYPSAPAQPNPNPFLSPTSSPWDLPSQNTPANPTSNPWDQPPQVAPIPTPPPPPELAPIQPEYVNPPTPIQSGPTPSPLDNPWGAPVQAPTIVGTAPAVPTDSTSTGGLPSWLPNSLTPTPQPQQPEQLPAASQPEPAPTDLSHLISNNSQPDPNQPPPQNPETLVVPPASPETSPTIPTENHKEIPKWLIGIGVGLLLVVAGASAYFILGVGQTSKTPESVPATQETTQQTIRTVAPPAASPAAQPAASSPANFGQLEGSGTTQQATSAADLLRQRQ